MKPKITVQDAAACLGYLRKANKSLTAAVLAKKLGCGGNRETQRRKVRAIIKHLREQGHMIVATLESGYALVDECKLWNEYLEGKKIEAKRIFKDVKRLDTGRQGQGVLFGLGGIGCGLG